MFWFDCGKVERLIKYNCAPAKRDVCVRERVSSKEYQVHFVKIKMMSHKKVVRP
mgnify:CR=1 FL=1